MVICWKCFFVWIQFIAGKGQFPDEDTQLATQQKRELDIFFLKCEHYLTLTRTL